MAIIKEAVFSKLKRFAKRLILGKRDSKSVEIRMLRNFSDHNGISVPEPPKDFQLAGFSMKFAGELVDLLNVGNDLGHWDEERLQRDILADLIPGTGFLLFHHGELIGASAAVFLDLYKPYAVLAYPILHPAHRGSNLGYMLISNTMAECFCSGYPGILLHTQPHRKSAIRTYERLGFVVVAKA